MKIRNGFVSNSSSSSFVLLLDNITKDGLERVKAAVKQHNDSDGEGYLGISKRFVLGQIDQHYGEIVMNVLEELNVPERDYEDYC